MMRTVVGLAILVAGLSFILPGSTPASARKKCGQPANHAEPITVIDGRIIREKPSAALEQLNPADIVAIEMLCMNPQDSTFNRTRGIPVLSVTTKKGRQTPPRI